MARSNPGLLEWTATSIRICSGCFGHASNETRPGAVVLRPGRSGPCRLGGHHLIFFILFQDRN